MISKSLIHGSSSPDWCAGMPAHEGRSQLGKLCEIFCRMFGVFFVGIGAGRTSSLIKETLGMNFQLDLISSCCAVQPCHPLFMLCQFNFR
jgi:hypothetical protein